MEVPSAPSPTLGVLGAGQLAWMLGRVAKALGWKLRIIGGKTGDPAVSIADEHIPNPTQFDQFGLSGCEWITFESEFVDFDVWEKPLSQIKNVYPNPKILQLLADKWEQKLLFKKYGLPFVPGELNSSLVVPTSEVVAKWARQGYDGYGNLFLPEESARWEEFQARATKQKSRIYLEPQVDFESECACVIARDCKGIFFHYPLFITEQRSGICEWVYGPADSFYPEMSVVHNQLLPKLENFMNQLGYVGVMAFEFFWCNGELLLNEVAPRVHNSGHVTLDGFNVNQFQLHLQAPLGFIDDRFAQDPMIFAMKNILGTTDGKSTKEGFDFTENNYHTYWYGKKILRPGRKLGHINSAFEEGTSVEKIKESLRLAEEQSWARIIS